jgi:hypothetical protein
MLNSMVVLLEIQMAALTALATSPHWLVSGCGEEALLYEPSRQG